MGLGWLVGGTRLLDGFCAIHLAARNGFTTIAAKLLDAGANVESTTPLGWTPLMCSIQAKAEGCAKLLVRHGAQTKTCVHGSIAAMAKSAGIKLR